MGVLGMKCAVCGRMRPPERLEAGHIIDRSAGGHSGYDNLVPMCDWPCNRLKPEHKTREEYESWVARGGAIRDLCDFIIGKGLWDEMATAKGYSPRKVLLLIWDIIDTMPKRGPVKLAETLIERNRYRRQQGQLHPWVMLEEGPKRLRQYVTKVDEEAGKVLRLPCR